MAVRKKPEKPQGLARAVLLALYDLKAATADDLKAALGRGPSVTVGTVWTVLSRARHWGLVERERSSGVYRYRLTAGGFRRVQWINEQQEE